MSPEDINDFWQYEAQRENPNVGSRVLLSRISADIRRTYC
jgi:hypothetical protein